MSRLPLAAALAALASSSVGCRSVALNAVANAAASTGDNYASDPDPELVRDAVPFGLKTMEGLLAEKPEHERLLTALAGNFTQYAYGFVQLDAELADLDGKYEAARAGRDRARKLYLRARDYGLRGLEVRHPGLGAALRDGKGVKEAVAKLEKGDLPLVYWTASAWTLAISNGKDDMGLVATLPVPIAMMERALAVDEAWNEGAIHEFFVAYDAARTEAEGGGRARVEQHLARAAALSMNKKLGPRVSFAEGVLVQAGDRAAFTRTLEEVVRADPGEVPRYRLANLLAQKKARALLAHADDLFVD